LSMVMVEVPIKRVNVYYKVQTLPQLARDRVQTSTSTKSMSTSGKMSMLDFQVVVSLEKSWYHITSKQ
jgi:hypothetical protein